MKAPSSSFKNGNVDECEYKSGKRRRTLTQCHLVGRRQTKRRGKFLSNFRIKSHAKNFLDFIMQIKEPWECRETPWHLYGLIYTHSVCVGFPLVSSIRMTGIFDLGIFSSDYLSVHLVHSFLS
mmetsp:Transcript_14690/g.22431  ORF Transcript_14690/g.22431 Transcript_14690/m.22431 type:complete len:123 (-) Transcript_14690:53-421(-)